MKETTQRTLINSKHPGRRKSSRIWKASNLRETRIACKQGYKPFSSAEDVSGDIRLTDAKPGREGCFRYYERIASPLPSRISNPMRLNTWLVCTQRRFVETYPRNDDDASQIKLRPPRYESWSYSVVVLSNHRVFHPLFLFISARSLQRRSFQRNYAWEWWTEMRLTLWMFLSSDGIERRLNRM